jgi:antitoxin component YwqK of YwqJK toxin-antitoxin module
MKITVFILLAAFSFLSSIAQDLENKEYYENGTLKMEYSGKRTNLMDC